MIARSALQDSLRAERNRIRALWRAPRRAILPALCFPSQPEKSLSERVAEAKKFRGTVSESKLHAMISAIYSSARERGEIINGVPICDNLPEETIMTIQIVVAEHFNITRDELLSLRKYPMLIIPRQVSMYLSTILVSHSLCFIGRQFGHDHSIIRAAARKIKRMIADDAAFSEEVEMLKSLLHGH